MEPIYLDNHATTRVDPRVLDAILPWLGEQFGNPSSKAHVYGRRAADAVANARSTVAATIGARADDIVFTSGATESINLAVRGIVRGRRDGRDHVVTLATEHKAVLDSCKAVQDAGGSFTIVDVQPDGRVALDRLAAAITDDTALVAVMAVNNEIGVVQPLAEIGALCRDRGVDFFCDGAQAPGRMAIDVDALGIDAMSLTAHKCYGPKGAGCLYIRRSSVRVAPLTVGGGQEFGLRSGTLATHQIIGLATALDVAVRDLDTDSARITALRDRLLARLQEGVPELVVNGSLRHRVAGNLNVAIPCVDANTLLMMLDQLALSSGSACSTGSTRPSHVLMALGVQPELAHCSLRFGLGRFNTEADIDLAAELVVAGAAKLRAASPLWTMRRAGVAVGS